MCKNRAKKTNITLPIPLMRLNKAIFGLGGLELCQKMWISVHHLVMSKTNFRFTKISNIFNLSVCPASIQRFCYATLQSMVNAKLSQQRFWPCHENGLIKTIQTKPHNLQGSVKLTSLYCGLRLILVYPNPQ